SSFSDADKDRLRLGMGEIYLNLNLSKTKPAPDERQWNSQKASELWAKVAANQKFNLAIRFRLLELAFALGQEENLAKWQEDIQKLEGKGGAFTAYGEAAGIVLRYKNLLLNSKSSDEDKDKAKAMLVVAHESLALAAKLRPKWSRVPWMDGM